MNLDQPVPVSEPLTPIEKIVGDLRRRAAEWSNARMLSEVQRIMTNFEHIPPLKQAEIIADYIKRTLQAECEALAYQVEDTYR